MKSILLSLIVFISLSAESQSISAGNQKGTFLLWLDENIEVEHWLAEYNGAATTEFKLMYNYPVLEGWNYHAVSPKNHFLNLFHLQDEVINNEGVKSFTRNLKVEIRKSPDDPYYFNQWNLERINVENVWDVTTGGATISGDEIVVAILDSGFDILNQDLQDNLWHNPDEIPGDGIDNDNNGFAEDYYGWNFKDNQAEFDVRSHGTSVAGIVGAKGDNDTDISGVNWDVKMLLLQIDYIEDVVKAYEYILQKRRKYNNTNGEEGAYIVVANGSFGISGSTCDEFPELGAMYDSLGQVGILSTAATDNSTKNIDTFGDLPTDCPSPFLITVTNTTKNETVRGGFGKNTIDLGAPGEGIITTTINNSIDMDFSGTSAACPLVSGAIALLYSVPCQRFIDLSKTNPSVAAETMKSFILNGVDSISVLSDKTLSGGRLNIAASAKLVEEFCDIKRGPLEIVKIYPNPFGGFSPSEYNQITIEFQIPEFVEQTVIVHNTLGQLVYREEFLPNILEGSSKTLDLNYLQAGLYHITLGNEQEGFVSSKIIKL